jgi:hypothetical protein
MKVLGGEVLQIGLWEVVWSYERIVLPEFLESI